MKRIVKVLLGAMIGLGFASCGSTANVAETPAPASTVPKQNSVTRETIDWKGSGMGAGVPDWAVAAMGSDFDNLSPSIQKRIEGKFYIVIDTYRTRKDASSTKDLKMAQEEASANYMVNIARSLNSAVDARFNGVLSANEDSQKTLVATAANARFTGFTRVADTWVLQRTNDIQTKKVTDTYAIVQIYACDQSLWEEQAANYIRELAKKAPDSEDMQKAAAMADELAASIKPGKITDSQ